MQRSIESVSGGIWELDPLGEPAKPACVLTGQFHLVSHVASMLLRKELKIEQSGEASFDGARVSEILFVQDLSQSFIGFDEIFGYI